MERIFKLYDFNVYHQQASQNDYEAGDDDNSSADSRQNSNHFMIQMFGIDELGKTYSVIAEEFKPFFYVKVEESWNLTTKTKFLQHIKKLIGKYHENSICECKIIKRKKLYGFDGGKEHKFIVFKFNNIQAFNRAKNLWYDQKSDPNNRKLLTYGFKFNGTSTYLYESNIPPLLRLFHIQDMSPSGWVKLPAKKYVEYDERQKKTNCDYECRTHYKNIIPLNDCEKMVPYKICSFDIEASSSHGDFPVPIKSYKKLATNIVDYLDKKSADISLDALKEMLMSMVLTAFGYYDETIKDYRTYIDLVYPKNPFSNQEECYAVVDNWLNQTHFLEKRDDDNAEDDVDNQMTIEEMFENMGNDSIGEVGGGEDGGDEGYDESNGAKMSYKLNKNKKTQKVCNDAITNVLLDKSLPRETKLTELNRSFSKRNGFPPLEGDRVTFIGSTFMKYGDKEPYLNHCAVLNTCSELSTVEKSVIETYKTEKEVLLAWKKIIQLENPDIIIGYNIFGFDYEFMFRRAEETKCVEEFLKLSKNKNEVCGTLNEVTKKLKIEETSISIASGQHDLKYIKMNGRIQIDLYNYFRREENLTSYKLDFVAGHFIGDYVKSLLIENDTSIIKSGNLTGLFAGSYIHIEEIGHTTEYYDNGAKYPVIGVDKTSGTFIVQGEIQPDMNKKVRWCLAKDDVTPKDIFRMTNGSADDRAVIAKYCIQDCNLVHYLLNKVDVITGFVEMAKICSVPINFLILRGQGIKLTSYVAKKCREKRTLMPVLNKLDYDDGYEGAIVLDPKCDLYLDNPVACVDYASLYPSSMMSENISHDSKVWTKEYNLAGVLIRETGEMDKETGEFVYDNLPDYEYVDITYDTFKYVRKNPTAAAEKVKSGYKICRFAQFPNGTRAIMPSILEELLMARKTTRKMIPLQEDEFMKNVLDKRQLGYKVTANSLYGQCGARTSSFYEKDCAASTTATGRLLLTYAKKVVEECYGDALCETSSYGPVLTKAEYIYGDSVASYTPVYVRYKKREDSIDILPIDELVNKYGNGIWRKCKEAGKQEKEVCEFQDLESWSEQGWTPLYCVIRHQLAPHKKMMRILTNTGMVDVTDDHSLLLPTGEMISPNDVDVGTRLLHKGVEFVKKPEHYTGKKYPKMFELDIQDGNHCKVASQCCFGINYGYYPFFVDQHKVVLMSNDEYIEDTDSKNIVKYIEELPYEGYVYDLTTANHHFAAGIGNMIVHNTDSVFFTFNLQTPQGEPIRGKKALEITIELAQEAGHLASTFLKGPHDLEYEKTFMPFCLLSKKRYVGMLYETDPNKGKRKEMGIVLKRRDNAPIVKDIYGGIIDILMKEQDVGKAATFLRTCLRNMVDENYPMDKLIISKSLRSGYKNPQQISHKVLADRMTERDPGNKPSSGDRIPYVFIHNANKKALQGEKIETPSFVKEQGLKIDYSHYITNQIMKPVTQLFALVLEKMWAMQNKKSKIIKFKKEVETLCQNIDPSKFEDKLEKLKNKEVKALLFDEFLRETNNSKEGNRPMTSFFQSKKK
jgi:DNA polymerase elongation subunit (family B)